MLRGVCACNPGYKQARDSAVKCLSVGESIISINSDAPTKVFIDDLMIELDEESINNALERSIVVHGTDGSRIACGVIEKTMVYQRTSEDATIE